MQIIFRVIKIFQKDRNLTFFLIYLYEINILPSAWDHYIQNFIKIHVIIRRKMLTSFYKN